MVNTTPASWWVSATSPNSWGGAITDVPCPEASRNEPAPRSVLGVFGVLFGADFTRAFGIVIPSEVQVQEEGVELIEHCRHPGGAHSSPISGDAALRLYRSPTPAPHTSNGRVEQPARRAHFPNYETSVSNTFRGLARPRSIGTGEKRATVGRARCRGRSRRDRSRDLEATETRRLQPPIKRYESDMITNRMFRSRNRRTAWPARCLATANNR